MRKSRMITLLLNGLLLTSLMLLGTGCQKEQTESIKAGDYFPRTVGSYWKYKGAGNEYASFSREVVFAGDNRVQLKENNGGTMTDAVYEITDMQVSRVYFIGESYEKKNFLDQKGDQNQILLKLPLKQGESWENTDDQREVVSRNVSVDTPAGTFDQCVKIKISPQPAASAAVTFEYYKEGVGLVKREFVSGGDTISSTLEDYKIK